MCYELSCVVSTMFNFCDQIFVLSLLIVIPCLVLLELFVPSCVKDPTNQNTLNVKAVANVLSFLCLFLEWFKICLCHFYCVWCRELSLVLIPMFNVSSNVLIPTLTMILSCWSAGNKPIMVYKYNKNLFLYPMPPLVVILFLLLLPFLLPSFSFLLLTTMTLWI